MTFWGILPLFPCHLHFLSVQIPLYRELLRYFDTCLVSSFGNCTFLLYEPFSEWLYQTSNRKTKNKCPQPELYKSFFLNKNELQIQVDTSSHVQKLRLLINKWKQAFLRPHQKVPTRICNWDMLASSWLPVLMEGN